MSSIELAPRHKQGLSLTHPTMTAAGCFGYTALSGQLVEMASLGAVVTNPVSLRPRHGPQQPRLVEIPGGLVLNTGQENPGVRRVIQSHAGRWRRLGVPVIVHLARDLPEAVARCAQALASTGAVAALEVELDANMPSAEVGALLQAAQTGELPLLVKLPLANARQLACISVEWGADALVIGAPPPAAAYHPSGQLVTGRLYGPTLHALAMAALVEIRRQVDVPLVGCGGIHSLEDARAFLRAGASAVQLDSILWLDPARANQILHALSSAQDA